MASFDQFVAKTGIAYSNKPAKSSSLKRYNIDKVILKHMNKGDVSAAILKKQNKILSRAELNDELIQNIKTAQIVSKKFDEKVSSFTELWQAKSRTSASSRTDYSPLSRSSPGLEGSGLHGFYYRPDGNIRSSRDDSAEMLEKLSQRDFSSLKETLAKTTMLHTRDYTGNYKFTPMLNELIKVNYLTSKVVPNLEDNLDIFRYITEDYQPREPIDEEEMRRNPHLRDRVLIGRDFYIRENEIFIKEMMQNIDLLDQHARAYEDFTNFYRRHIDSYEKEVPLRGGRGLSKSEPTFRTQSVLRTNRHSISLGTSLARSSISTRYGLESPPLDSKNLLLEQQIDAEQKKMSEIDLEIGQYIQDIEKETKVKEERNTKKESPRKTQLEILNTESENIVYIGDNPSEITESTTSLQTDEE